MSLEAKIFYPAEDIEQDMGNIGTGKLRIFQDYSPLNPRLILAWCLPDRAGSQYVLIKDPAVIIRYNALESSTDKEALIIKTEAKAEDCGEISPGYGKSFDIFPIPNSILMARLILKHSILDPNTILSPLPTFNGTHYIEQVLDRQIRFSPINAN